MFFRVCSNTYPCRKTARKYKPYKNSRFDTPEDMLLFILIYLREVRSLACLNLLLIDLILPLAAIGKQTPPLIIINQNIMWIRRPKDPSQKAYYSGKKKCHTVKNNLMRPAKSSY